MFYQLYWKDVIEEKEPGNGPLIAVMLVLITTFWHHPMALAMVEFLDQHVAARTR